MYIKTLLINGPWNVGLEKPPFQASPAPLIISKVMMQCHIPLASLPHLELKFHGKISGCLFGRDHCIIH
jgi:hypothetical protein